MKAGMFYSKWLPQLTVGKGQNPRSYDEFGPLATYLRYVERSSRKLARSTFYGMGRSQAKLEQKQSFLGRLVDIGAELFAISSAVCYANNTIGREHPERKAEGFLELAELFSQQAKRRADGLFHALWANDDDAIYAAALRMLDGRYTWLEEGVMDPSGEGPMIPPLDESAAGHEDTAASHDGDPLPPARDSPRTHRRQPGRRSSARGSPISAACGPRLGACDRDRKDCKLAELGEGPRTAVYAVTGEQAASACPSCGGVVHVGDGAGGRPRHVTSCTGKIRIIVRVACGGHAAVSSRRTVRLSRGQTCAEDVVSETLPRRWQQAEPPRRSNRSPSSSQAKRGPID